jgi:hypothetical protein
MSKQVLGEDHPRNLLDSQPEDIRKNADCRKLVMTRLLGNTFVLGD